MTLDQLPPRYKEQAMRKLGLFPRGNFALFEKRMNTTSTATTPEQPTACSQVDVGNKNSAKDSKKVVEDLFGVVKTKHKARPTLTPDQADTIVRSVNVSEDGNEVKFILNVSPAALPTAQQKGAFVGKDGRVHFFTKAKVAKAEKALVKALSPYAHLTRKWGDNVSIAVSIVFCFPYPSSTPKKNLVQYGFHTSRPDVDNIFKGFGDALTEAGFWIDDSIISDLHLKKFRVTDSPRIGLSIKNLNPSRGTLFDNIQEKPLMNGH